MNIRYLGHSAFAIETGGQSVLIDPFIEGNPACPVPLADLRADVVIVTHAHGDHWGSTLELAARGATVVSTAEIAGYAAAHGAPSVRAMNIGGSASLPFGRLRFTPAWHSSSFPDGTYGGMPMGVLLELEGKRLYHAGDTDLFSDMALIGTRFGKLDLAMLPIGDNFTMGPEGALEALALLRPRAVVPMHYDTFELIKQDGPGFAARAASQGAEGFALKPGERLEL